ncbi:hypothetical protein [Nocardia thailandica]|uniref:hypothetical protein n=1 Tax=Nocardia thailandica TaxID=257275 RepID=UPI0002F768B6|nr:hypothetical protein [Nocardia thailandica]
MSSSSRSVSAWTPGVLRTPSPGGSTRVGNVYNFNNMAEQATFQRVQRVNKGVAIKRSAQR